MGGTGGMDMRSIGATLLLGTILAAPAAAAAERPNIVLILGDDLGWGDVGFNGRKAWTTPNLDRLAAQGTTFRRFYTAGAVCNPSRAAIMTGRSTIHCGVTRNVDDLPAREVTIAEALKGRGYATGLFGKWHQGRPRPGASAAVHPMDQGFDEFFGYVDAQAAWEKFPKRLWDGRAETPVSGYADDLFTDRAVDFLRRHKNGPFFLYVPYINSHFNIAAPAEDVDRFRGKFPEADPNRPVNATYAAMVERLDRNVGRLLAALEAQGLADNTLVVFTSDQGATFESGNKGASVDHDSNAPFRGQKRTLWEGGMRVPAAARWPGHVPSGKVSDEVMQTIDLLPTFLDVAGASPDPARHLDGVDLLPAWTGRGIVPERTLFFEWRAEGADLVAALRGDLKLVIQRGGRPELYNVVADPAERRDIAALHPDVVRRLQRELKAWLATEEKKPEGDLGRVQGTWKARYGPGDIPITIEIKGDVVTATLTREDGDLTLKGKLKIDDKAKPHRTVDWLDFKLPSGDDAQESLGIYELNAKGDEWKVCNGAPGKPRPTEFKEGDNGEDPRILVFRRPKDER